MGIVNWFTKDLESTERILTRDLISMAIADGEFTEDERQEVLRICNLKGISNVELIDSIRGSKKHIVHTDKEKRDYIIFLPNVLKADNYYSLLELHLLKTLGAKIGISPMRIISIITAETKEGRLSQKVAFNLVDSFANFLIDIEKEG